MPPSYAIVRLDPREANTLYSNSTRLWTSRDGGETWRPLSTATTDGSDWSVYDQIQALALPSRESPLLLIGKGNVLSATVTVSVRETADACATRGSAGGGTFVVIDGRGFASGAGVSFSGLPATEVAVLGSTALTARTPPHAAGPVDVSVTIPGTGTGALGNAFRYEALESANRSTVDRAGSHPPARNVPPR